MISQNKVVMCIIFILVGFFVCFFGRKLFRPILFIAGILLGVGLVWLLCYSTFLDSNDKAWVFWLVFGISLLIGIGLGFLFFKLTKLGAFLLAGWGGYSLGLLLYNAFLYKIDSQVFFWCFTLGMALVAGLLVCVAFEHILILSTAMAGSFLAIAGIGLVAGGYQNPFTIVEEVKQGVYTSINPVFYAYMAGTLVLWALGALVQYRQKRRDDEDGKDPYHRLR